MQSSISGGTQAVTGFPWPKLEENSRHETQQPETHDHQWWLDVSLIRQASTWKQTGDSVGIDHGTLALGCCGCYVSCGFKRNERVNKKKKIYTKTVISVARAKVRPD